jgi:hypothetical protein
MESARVRARMHQPGRERVPGGVAHVRAVMTSARAAGIIVPTLTSARLPPSREDDGSLAGACAVGRRTDTRGANLRRTERVLGGVLLVSTKPGKGAAGHSAHQPRAE